MVEPTAPTESSKRAAQYLRMSTEHQRYSIEHQGSAIDLYAAAHGLEIVASYADEGVSGLGIKKRKGLRQLLADVLGGGCSFDTILVYDVSRWGRFQNPDQSAHYEFLCAEAGVKVEYCAELFANDGSLSSTILKGLKRVMAAEYSRELSAKVSATKLALLKAGYWQGGSAGYGLRRQMITPDGQPDRIMEFGEFKAIQGFRTILVPGPAPEVAVVRRIYRMFTEVGLSRPAIVDLLNAQGVPSQSGKRWTYNTVDGVLKSPKYVGDLVGNRSTGLLGAPRVRKDEADWVRKPQAFAAIVSRQMFAAAQRRRQDLAQVELPREAMVEALRQIHAKHGKITSSLINTTPGLPSAARFKTVIGLSRALYTAIGARPRFPPRRPLVRIDDDEILRRLSALYARAGHLSRTLIDRELTLPAATTIAERFGGLRAAYARIGFVPMSHKMRGSPVGRARLTAAEHRFDGAPWRHKVCAEELTS